MKKRSNKVVRKTTNHHDHHIGIAIVVVVISVLFLTVAFVQPSLPIAGEAIRTITATKEITPYGGVNIQTDLISIDYSFEQKVKKVIKEGLTFRNAKPGRTCSSICQEERQSPPAKSPTSCLAVVTVSLNSGISVFAKDGPTFPTTNYQLACDVEVSGPNTLCVCI